MKVKLPLSILVIGFVLSVMTTAAVAAEKAKTITGTASCGGCSGVADGCCLLLTDKDGGRWVLKGNSESLKAAFQQRSSGKTMTAKLAGKPLTKKGKDGQDYKEVKVSEVKVGS